MYSLHPLPIVGSLSVTTTVSPFTSFFFLDACFVPRGRRIWKTLRKNRGVPQDVVVAVGHSLFFRSVFRVCLPRGTEHVSKKKKLVNGRTIMVTLREATMGDGWREYMINPMSMAVVYGNSGSRGGMAIDEAHPLAETMMGVMAFRLLVTETVLLLLHNSLHLLLPITPPPSQKVP